MNKIDETSTNYLHIARLLGRRLQCGFSWHPNTFKCSEKFQFIGLDLSSVATTQSNYHLAASKPK